MCWRFDRRRLLLLKVPPCKAAGSPGGVDAASWLAFVGTKKDFCQLWIHHRTYGFFEMRNSRLESCLPTIIIFSQPETSLDEFVVAYLWHLDHL